MNYVFATELDLSDLEFKINKLIEDGYILEGNILTVLYKTHHTFTSGIGDVTKHEYKYIQKLVKK